MQPQLAALSSMFALEDEASAQPADRSPERTDAPAAAVDPGGTPEPPTTLKTTTLPAVSRQKGMAVDVSCLADCLLLLNDNTSDIAAAEEHLQHLLTKQTSLLFLERRLEQERVLAAIKHPLGNHRGRPVAAMLLLRCLQQWGVLHADSSPVLEQLASVMQQQLDAEDESAPAEVAGLQCHAAYWLTVSAVLLCLLFKTTQPALAEAALKQAHGKHSGAAAAEVMQAARKKVGELQKQLSERMAHMGGLQALGKRFGALAWGSKQKVAGSGSDAKEQQEHLPVCPAAEAVDECPDDAAAASSSSSAAAAAADAGQAPAAAGERPAAAGSAASSFTSTAPGTAAAGQQVPVPLQFFMLCLDQQVQRCFVLLRDQLKRRLSPLLADCMLNPAGQAQEQEAISSSGSGSSPGLSAAAVAAAAEVAAAHGEQLPGAAGVVSPPLSPSAAGAAVAGTAAACAATAEPLLLAFRSWSELVGVLHAALVALRDAGVPRQLRAMLMQQVLEFINCQMFNSLLLRPECCSSSNARYVLRGLKQLDGWILAEQSSIGGSCGTGGSSSSSLHGPWLQEGASSTKNCEQQQQQQQHQLVAGSSDTATMGGAAATDGLSSWEEVSVPMPADTGEIDSWQPPAHQQQRRQQQQPSPSSWWRTHQQQKQGKAGQSSEHEMGPEAWNALSHVRQALQFLVLDHKGALSLEDLSSHICPALNHQHLYRLCTTAWDEAPGEDGVVSGEVLEEMKAAHTLSSNGGLIVTFLLDEPAGLPFVAPADDPGGGAGGGVRGSPAAVADAGGSSGRFGRCRASAVVSWDDGRGYGEGVPVPVVLVDEGSPAEVWAFLTDEQPWPWPVVHGAPAAAGSGG